MTRSEFRRFLMVSKMGQELERMSTEERNRISTEMFESIDGDGNQTIDFDEFFHFYQVCVCACACVRACMCLCACQPKEGRNKGRREERGG